MTTSPPNTQSTQKSRLLRLLLALFVALTLVLWQPPPTQAQPPPPNPFTQPVPAAEVEWRELETEHFIIVYAHSVEGLSRLTCACGIDEAEHYQAFIDDIYQDLVDVFDVELDTPINLRLFPTEESYYEVNPLARQITGVIAHALNNRSEIAIALPRTERLTDEEIVNNVRHELTHFFASYLSDGNLTTGFQEGIAQYLEKPNDNSSYDPTVLEQALAQNRLLSWAQLDSSREVWRDPQVAYPQSLSIVAFLIDRYGYTKFLEFVAAHAAEPGYRSALEVTYEKSADELEAEWLAYLPEYFDGRWQINVLYAYDLSRVRTLVEQGAFTDAETELLEIVTLLETTEQPETLAEAQQLLQRAEQGRAAGVLAGEARRALEANEYEATIARANESMAAFEALAYYERIPELQIYIQRAEIGQAALNQLDHGEQLLNSPRFFEAESQLMEATVMLQSLGNQSAAARGLALLEQLSERQSLLAYGMLAVAVLLALFNGVRRLIFRLSANPLEVEYT